jgi:hypothetical protein
MCEDMALRALNPLSLLFFSLIIHLVADAAHRLVVWTMLELGAVFGILSVAIQLALLVLVSPFAQYHHALKMVEVILNSGQKLRSQRDLLSKSNFSLNYERVTSCGRCGRL